MLWLIPILALLTGGALGAFAVYRILLKHYSGNNSELTGLRMKNVEMQTTINIQQQQFEAEKQLIKDSYAREKQTITENHQQKLKMLQEQSDRSFAEMEKIHQARLAQLKEEFKYSPTRSLKKNPANFRISTKLSSLPSSIRSGTKWPNSKPPWKSPKIKASNLPLPSIPSSAK